MVQDQEVEPPATLDDLHNHAVELDKAVAVINRVMQSVCFHLARLQEGVPDAEDCKK